MVALAGCSTGDTGGTPTPEANETGTGTGTDAMNDTTPSGEMGTESGTEMDDGDTSSDNDTDMRTGDDEGISTGDDGDTSFDNDTDIGTGDDENTTTDDGFNSLSGVSNGEVTNDTALVNASGYRIFGAPTDFELSASATEGSFTFTLRNDSEQTLLEIDEASQDGKSTYYITEDDTYAKRNTSSGEVTYGDSESAVAFEAGFSLLVPAIYVDYLGLMQWETGGTTTIDGEEAYVFESDAINQTALQESSYNAPALENATSASARLVVGPDGVMHEASIETESPNGGAMITYDLSTDSDIDVTQPSWFDQSEADATTG